MTKNGTSGRCSRCETLPEKIVGPGKLHLWLPLDHTLAKTHRRLRAGGWECETPGITAWSSTSKRSA